MPLYNIILENKSALIAVNNTFPTLDKLYQEYVKSVGGKENIAAADVSQCISHIMYGEMRRITPRWGLYSHVLSREHNNYLSEWIVDNFTVTKKDIISMAKAIARSPCIDISISWINTWNDRNKNTKFTASEKKLLLQIGYIAYDIITQPIFESCFKSMEFVISNLGTIDTKGGNYSNKLNIHKTLGDYYNNVYQRTTICNEHATTKESINMYLETLPHKFIINSEMSVKFTETCLTNMLKTLDARNKSAEMIYQIYLLRFLVASNIKISYQVIAGLYVQRYISSCTKQSIEIILDHVHITSDAIDYFVAHSTNSHDKYYINSMAARIINYTIPLHAIARGITHIHTIGEITHTNPLGDGDTSDLMELFLCNSHIVLTQEIMDMSVRYDNHILYRKCVDAGLKHNKSHIRYAILHDNATLLGQLIDNKFILTVEDMKYNISHSPHIVDIVNTSLFEKYLVGKAENAVKSMSSYVHPRFGLFENVAGINFDAHPFELLMYAMKFPEEFVNMPMRKLLCIGSMTIRLLLFDIIDEFKTASTDKIIKALDEPNEKKIIIKALDELKKSSNKNVDTKKKIIVKKNVQ